MLKNWAKKGMKEIGLVTLTPGLHITHTASTVNDFEDLLYCVNALFAASN